MSEISKEAVMEERAAQHREIVRDLIKNGIPSKDLLIRWGKTVTEFTSIEDVPDEVIRAVGEYGILVKIVEYHLLAAELAERGIDFLDDEARKRFYREYRPLECHEDDIENRFGKHRKDIVVPEYKMDVKKKSVKPSGMITIWRPKELDSYISPERE